MNSIIGLQAIHPIVNDGYVPRLFHCERKGGTAMELWLWCALQFKIFGSIGAAQVDTSWTTVL
jgi:hypothetical protein